ncbi:MAG: hypothetical protein HYR93_01045, partial [Chloroflexi bacterium]|nr:hypothetical protein [Chloroflexota bacterium]
MYTLTDKNNILSKRENEALDLLINGKSNKQIALE